MCCFELQPWLLAGTVVGVRCMVGAGQDGARLLSVRLLLLHDHGGGQGACGLLAAFGNTFASCVFAWLLLCLCCRDVHKDFKKRGFGFTDLQSGVMVCRPCHSAIHRLVLSCGDYRLAFSCIALF
jgi:hypothetical protein